MICINTIKLWKVSFCWTNRLR